MTISEAFDEVLASSGEGSEEVKNILGALGCSVPEDEYGPDTAFIQNEIKVIAGVLLVESKVAAPSFDAKKTLHEGLAKICAGKPLEGVSDAVMDAEVTDNLDLL
jgi:hypothetical protein